MNCGYVKTTWFPLSYIIIVIIIYSFTIVLIIVVILVIILILIVIYIYVHIIATLHVFFPGFPLTSTWIQRPAGHFSGQAKSLVGIEEASHTGEWWMVGGCISNPGMVGEWLVNGSPETWQSPSRSPSWHVRPCLRMHDGCTPRSCLVHQSTGTFPLINVRLKLGMLCF